MKVCGTPYEMEVTGLPYRLWSRCDTLHLSFNVSSAKHCSYSYEFCFCPIIFTHSIKFRQRWKSAALHMKWKWRDCHIGYEAGVTPSTYRLMWRAPKHRSYSYEFCFCPATFAHFIWILTLENAASLFRIDTSVLVVLSKLTSASAASFVRIDTSTPVRHFSMSQRKTFRLFHKTFEFNVLR